MFFLFHFSFLYSQDEFSKLDSLQLKLNDLEKFVSYGGDLIETGAMINNYGIAADIVGGVIAGVGCGISAVSGNHTGIYVSASIGGAFCLAGLILHIVGNNKIGKGGALLRHVNFSGSGVSFSIGKDNKRLFINSSPDFNSPAEISVPDTIVHSPDDYSEYVCYKKYESQGKYYLKYYSEKSSAIRTITVGRDVYYRLYEGQPILKSDIEPYLNKK